MVKSTFVVGAKFSVNLPAGIAHIGFKVEKFIRPLVYPNMLYLAWTTISLFEASFEKPLNKPVQKLYWQELDSDGLFCKRHQLHPPHPHSRSILLGLNKA